jgi:CheY-like chemotaxis protein
MVAFPIPRFSANPIARMRRAAKAGRLRHDRRLLVRYGRKIPVNPRPSQVNWGCSLPQNELVLEDFGMSTDIVRNAPLNVLVLLADSQLKVAEILPALKPHFALVCNSPEQGAEAARQFEPDVVMVDLRIPDVDTLIHQISQAAGGRPIVFVAMPITAGPAISVPAKFAFSLPIPATMGELEHLLPFVIVPDGRA